MDIFRTATTKLDNRKFNDYLKRLKIATDNLNNDDLKTFLEVIKEDFRCDNRLTMPSSVVDDYISHVFEDEESYSRFRLSIMFSNCRHNNVKISVEELKSSFIKMIELIYAYHCRSNKEYGEGKLPTALIRIMSGLINDWTVMYMTNENYNEAIDNSEFFKYFITFLRTNPTIPEIAQYLILNERPKLINLGLIKS